MLSTDPRLARTLFTLALLLLVVPPLAAEVLEIQPARDVTLYGEPLIAEDHANGMGAHFFTGANGYLHPYRACLYFDIAGALPAGATVDAVELRCSMSRTNPLAAPQATRLYPLTSDWGEGSSDAEGEEGWPAPAEVGDATWVYRFWPDATWTTPGGDFSAALSAETVVDGVGWYSWSGPAMVQDVQGWLDAPAGNFGWLMQGNETEATTAKRFDSKDNSDPALRPRLIVTYSPPLEGCRLNCPAGDGGIITMNGSGNKSPDLNGSGDVTVADFGIFAVAFQTGDYCADFDCNGIVAVADFAIFAIHFSHGPGPAGICE